MKYRLLDTSELNSRWSERRDEPLDAADSQPDHELKHLAKALQQRNALDGELSAIISRPATTGHLGEWIAGQVFDIDLATSATQRGYDGTFASGPRAGATVNVKWYPKAERILDISAHPADYYLVLAGPTSVAASSLATTRPLVIDQVFLFDMAVLRTRLKDAAVQVGVATSVRAHEWAAAEIYPKHNPTVLALTPEQRDDLALFASPTSTG